MTDMTEEEKQALLSMSVEQLQTKLGINVEYPDISNHGVCQDCRGLCCEQFMIGVVIDDATGLPDWDAQRKRVADVPESDFAFIREHFKPLRQPGDAVYDARTVQVAGLTTDHQRQRHELWFTCTAFKNGRCSKYDQRPQVCRIHLCSPAKYRGINPELDIVRRDGQYEYREIFPAMDGPGDTNFVKPGLDTKKRMEENDERRKRLNAAIPERFPVAAKRCGITQTLDEFIDALDAADKVPPLTENLTKAES